MSQRRRKAGPGPPGAVQEPVCHAPLCKEARKHVLDCPGGAHIRWSSAVAEPQETLRRQCRYNVVRSACVQCRCAPAVLWEGGPARCVPTQPIHKADMYMQPCRGLLPQQAQTSPHAYKPGVDACTASQPADGMHDTGVWRCRRIRTHILTLGHPNHIAFTGSSDAVWQGARASHGCHMCCAGNTGPQHCTVRTPPHSLHVATVHV